MFCNVKIVTNYFGLYCPKIKKKYQENLNKHQKGMICLELKMS